MSAAAPSTPLLEQYEGVRARYPGHLVLFRVGDFYETFGDDARLLSRELDVVLTARAPDARGDRVPMAGVPHHAVETYLGRLVRRGYKVALCDQVEDARQAKGLVRREVTRVVTPGTVVEDRLLGGPDHSFLASVVADREPVGSYAAVDVTTGEWFRGAADGPGYPGLLSALAPFSPREVVYASATSDEASLLAGLRHEFPTARLEPAPSAASEQELPLSLRPAGPDGTAVGEADRRLVAYLRATQPRLLPHLSLVDRAAGGARLVLDPKTLRHLEITRPMNPDDPHGVTLLSTCDETVTAPGRRTLAFWLANPLADLRAIAARQDAVAALLEPGSPTEELRGVLRGVADLARIASRVAGRRVRPVELAMLRAALGTVERVRTMLGDVPAAGRLEELAAALVAPSELVGLLGSALPETVPVGDEAGAFFRRGHAEEVDAARAIEAEALSELAHLEHSEQEASGIRTLKVGYNQVFGYYFEVTRPHLAKVPPHFRRRQTVAQAERFTSDRLDELEHRILDARERLRRAGAEAWERLLDDVERHVGTIHRIARAIGELDALATFAHLARTRGYVRPTVDASSSLVVRDGRHPVLDRALAERFVPNDTDLDVEARRLLVLTGPNMSGKSTYMRQVGLLVVLAQAGSFVPARFARVGLVSRLYTRMGFTDEIGRGKSSFMVEMSEVAEILRGADARSLLLLDEVGRGTSTFDGLAIAWATLRHLHDATRARCVVATHYHQLADLVRGLPAAANAHLAVADRPEGIVFLHRLVPGATDKSYGVHVARLAGLPPDVLDEAARLVRQLEARGVAGVARTAGARARSPRYTQAVLVSEAASPDPLREEIARLAVDTMTPDEAVAALHELVRRAASLPPDGPAGSP